MVPALTRRPPQHNAGVHTGQTAIAAGSCGPSRAHREYTIAYSAEAGSRRAVVRPTCRRCSGARRKKRHERGSDNTSIHSLCAYEVQASTQSSTIQRNPAQSSTTQYASEHKSACAHAHFIAQAESYPHTFKHISEHIPVRNRAQSGTIIKLPAYIVLDTCSELGDQALQRLPVQQRRVKQPRSCARRNPGPGQQSRIHHASKSETSRKHECRAKQTRYHS